MKSKKILKKQPARKGASAKLSLASKKGKKLLKLRASSTKKIFANRSTTKNHSSKKVRRLVLGGKTKGSPQMSVSMSKTKRSAGVNISTKGPGSSRKIVAVHAQISRRRTPRKPKMNGRSHSTHAPAKDPISSAMVGFVENVAGAIKEGIFMGSEQVANTRRTITRKANAIVDGSATRAINAANSGLSSLGRRIQKW